MFDNLWYTYKVIVAISPKKTAETTWVPDDPINDSACDPVTGITYTVGFFESWGPDHGSGLPVSLTTGLANSNFPKINNYGEDQGSGGTPFSGMAVMSSYPDGAGGWYVGGQFTLIGGVERWSVAHVNSDGTLDENFNAGVVIQEQTPDATPTVASIYSMYFDGSGLWVVGNFNFIGGVSRSGVTILDGVTGAVIGPNFDPDGNVHVVAGGGSGVWVGGDFQSISGQPRNRLANYQGYNLGAFDANINPLSGSGTVYGIRTISNTQIAITGDFTSVNFVFRNNAAIIDLGTGLPTAFDPNLNDLGFDIDLDSNNTVYISGQFTSVNLTPVARRYLAAFDQSTGAVVTSWDPNPDDWVYSLQVGGSALYIGGIFDAVVATTRWHLAALSLVDGNPVSLLSWNPHPSDRSSVRTLKIEGSQIFVGGNFSSINAVTTGCVAGLNVDGLSVVPLSPNGAVNRIGHCILLTDFGGTKLIYAYDGVGATDAVEMIDTTGTVIWNTPMTGSGRDIHRIGSSSSFYIAGIFTAINGTSRNRIAEMALADGSLLSSNPSAFTGSTIDTICTVGASPTTLYIGGNFSSINGTARIDAADLSLGLSATGSWNPNPGGGSVINKILPSFDESFLYLAGDFLTLNGATSAPRVAGVNLTDGTFTGYNAAFIGSARSLCLGKDGSRLYISGDGGASSVREADAITGALYSWNPLTQNQPPFTTTDGNTPAIYHINFNEVTNTIFCGGDFSDINSLVQPRFALWQIPYQINIVGTNAVSGKSTPLSTTDNAVNTLGGAIFVTGLAGMTGMRGPTGFSPKGADFSGASYRGETGILGDQGLTGLDGIAVIGITGIRGSTGVSSSTNAETGIQGATGIRGASGLSSIYPLRVGSSTGLALGSLDFVVFLNRNFVADLFPLVVTLPSAASVGAGKMYSIRAVLGTAQRDVILQPTGGETINGQTSLALPWGFSTVGQSVDIYSNGTDYFARGALIGARGLTGLMGITGPEGTLNGIQGITGVTF
jgi:hypothetical protein